MSDRPARSTEGAGRGLGAAAALVALLAVLPYLNALPNGFAFDDPLVISENPMITRDPVAALATAVVQPGGLWRPLTMFSYAANHAISPAPFGFHLVNVLLHALVSVAVLMLAHRLLGSLFAATAAAALFAVHPIHSEAVAGVVGRAELLAALFVLATLLAVARGWTAAGLLAFAGAVLCKESAFTAIPLVGVTVWWTDPRRDLTRAARATLPFVAAGAAYLGLRLAVVGSLALPTPPPLLDNPLAHVPAAQRIATALVVLLEYCSQLLVPLHLSADYSYNEIPVVTDAGDGRWLLAAAVLATLTALVVATARRLPVVALAAVFAALPLALTANVLFPIGTIKAERLLYLPSVGVCLAAGWGLAAVARQRRAAALAALAALTLAFGARTWLRNPDWRDNLTLFQAAVQDAPGSAKAHYNLGVAHDQRGDADLAMLHLRQALLIHPECAEAAFAIGAVYERKGLDAGALHWYARALQLDWAYTRAHLNTGVRRLQRGEFAAAEAAFRTGLAQEPHNQRLQFGLGMALRAQGQLDEARLRLGALEDGPIDDPGLRDAVIAARLEDAAGRVRPATGEPLSAAAAVPARGDEVVMR